MPLLLAAERDAMRQEYRAHIHNAFVRARLQIGPDVTVPARPGYDPITRKNHTEFTDFPCSVYSMLSGKTTRVFRTRIEEMVFNAGLWNTTEWLVQFVPDSPELLLLSSAATNAIASSTQLDDNAEDFVTRGVQVGALVQNLTDGSTASVITIAATSLVTSALSGGTLNKYTSGDAYRILNPVACKTGDQFYIHDKWRTVLGVITDSEGVQSTALCSD